ncbi:hypothetical protein A6R68_07346 [Neotoma lepida]|uniref:Uncharacterized protein n=1 Tax=Neotoma lepida TaxID=56216 RepID=A0A1A6GCZ6_NEOLE|nr:hypothetical protein A6R68_07346 [Neotoma lepida]
MEKEIDMLDIENSFYMCKSDFASDRIPKAKFFSIVRYYHTMTSWIWHCHQQERYGQTVILYLLQRTAFGPREELGTVTKGPLYLKGNRQKII